MGVSFFLRVPHVWCCWEGHQQEHLFVGEGGGGPTLKKAHLCVTFRFPSLRDGAEVPGEPPHVQRYLGRQTCDVAPVHLLLKAKMPGFPCDLPCQPKGAYQQKGHYAGFLLPKPTKRIVFVAYLADPPYLSNGRA